ncbi:hypothetical protein Tco_0168469 [Tanacetum coccineum]
MSPSTTGHLRITELTPKHLEGPAYEVVKAFHPDVIHLQFQMEECHKLLINQVDDRLLKYNVSRPLPLGGPPGQVTIQTEFFFNRDGLSTIWQHGCGSKKSACMIFFQLMASPTGGLRDRKSTSTDTQQKPTEELLSPEPPTAKGQEDSLYCCQFMDQESGYQTMGRRLPTRHQEDKYGMQMIMRFNKIHKFSDGTLQQIDEALDYRVKEFRVNKVNLGLNTSSEESFGTWRALLVEEYEKETTDFFKEQNDDIFSVTFSTSCVTEMELVLEHTQQGTSNEVSVSTEGVVELKRNVKIKEHPSDTYVFTMKMEILLEPTSNKLMVEDPALMLEILSRRFFLRLNLPDHMSVLTDSKVLIKIEMASTCFSRIKFIATCSYSRLNNFTKSRKNDLKLPQL